MNITDITKRYVVDNSNYDFNNFNTNVFIRLL